MNSMGISSAQPQDLLTILDETGIDYKSFGEDQHVTQGWVNVQCPWCGDSSYHLGINLEFGYCNCWVCGRHRLADLLVESTRISLGSARKLLAGCKFQAVDKIYTKGKFQKPDGVSHLRRVHMTYLLKRGFNRRAVDQLIRLWEIKGIELAAKLSWRIWIPIFYQGNMVSWTTRSISDNVSSKYISAKPSQESVHHKSILYGEHYARQSVIVHEGPIDVWKVGPGAVCTFGVGFSFDQLFRLTKYAHRVICFDSQAPALRRARQLRNLLVPFPGKTTLVELDAKDPGSASPKEIKKLRRLLE